MLLYRAENLKRKVVQTTAMPVAGPVQQGPGSISDELCKALKHLVGIVGTWQE